MEKQKSIISPSGCIHADDPEEPGKQALCNHCDSYHWSYTNKPVTCKRCLKVLGKNKGMEYGVYKARTEVKSFDGRSKIQVTTWRGDFIEKILKNAMVSQAFKPGDKVTIEIVANDEEFMLKETTFHDCRDICDNRDIAKENSIEKTLDPCDGTVHLMDKRKKDIYGMLYLCACGKRTGLIWEKIDKNTPLGCLVCLIHEKKNKPLNKGGLI